MFDHFPKHHRAYSVSQSLMELLIGIGVAGVVFTAIASIVFTSLQGAMTSRERSLAQSLINAMYTTVQNVSSADWHSLWASSGGVGYWPLDEGAGAAGTNAIAFDEINGNNGTLSLGVSGNTSLATAWQSGASCEANGCISFDGTDDAISISNSSELQLVGDLTIAFWAKPTNIGKGRQNPLGKAYGGEFDLTMETTGYLNFYQGSYGGNGGTYMGCGSNSQVFSTSTWVFVVVTRDVNAQQIKMYKNGSVLSGAACGAWVAPSSSTRAMQIGYEYAGYFQGNIDEVRLYNRALSATEIANLYSGVTSFHPLSSAGIQGISEGPEQVVSSGVTFTRSFSLAPVQRDANNNIVSSGGTDDPLTRKLTMTVSWKGKTLVEQTYITRTGHPGSFVQANWSGGPGQMGAVFSAPSTFDTASSSVIYSVANQLNTQASGGAGAIDSVNRYAWSDTAGWADFYAVSYATTTGVFNGFATFPVGSISMNCLDTSCASSNYKTYQATSTGAVYTQGDMYGYGWSDSYGWVSFNCDQSGAGGTNSCATSNYKVSISTSTGDFAGWAWNDTLGWISFNCDQTRFGGSNTCGTSSYKVTLVPVTGFLDGVLTSAIFDTQISAGVVPVSMVWQGVRGNGLIKLKIASARTTAGPWVFLGADGTASTWYPLSGTLNAGDSVPIDVTDHYDKRYMRYQLYMLGATTTSVTINYYQ